MEIVPFLRRLALPENDKRNIENSLPERKHTLKAIKSQNFKKKGASLTNHVVREIYVGAYLVHSLLKEIGALLFVTDFYLMKVFRGGLHDALQLQRRNDPETASTVCLLKRG